MIKLPQPKIVRTVDTFVLETDVDFRHIFRNELGSQNPKSYYRGFYSPLVRIEGLKKLSLSKKGKIRYSVLRDDKDTQERVHSQVRDVVYAAIEMCAA